MTPLELLLYMLAAAGGGLPIGLVVIMFRSLDRADARRQDLERRKSGTLRGIQ